MENNMRFCRLLGDVFWRIYFGVCDGKQILQTNQGKTITS
jgi:hypothetical protein